MFQWANYESLKRLGALVSAFALFFVLAMFGMQLTRIADNIAIFRPADAAMVGLGLYFGLKRLPEILVGAMLANALTKIVFGDPLLMVLGLPVANAIEITLVLLVLKRFEIGLFSIKNIDKTIKFIGTICLMVVPTAVIGAVIVNLAYGTSIARTSIQWWADDVVSYILVLLPLLSAKPNKWSLLTVSKWTKTAVLEFLVGGVLFAAIMWLFIVAHIPPAIGLILPMLWVALRLGMFETAVATSVFTFFAMMLVASGFWHSGTAELSLHDEIFQLQVTSMLCALPAFFVAASIRSRKIVFSALKEREEEARSNFADLQVTLANMDQGISCFDADGRLTIWNEQYARIFGMAPEEVHHNALFLDLLAMQKKSGNFDGVARELQDLILRETGKGESFTGETEISQGRIVRSVHAPNPQGGWIATHEDVTEKRRIEKNIVHEALHDKLTGLPNRRFHEQEMTERSLRCHRTGEGLALLHVDLDRFKEINDTMGHAAGDAMLQHAAEVLRSFVRETDFVARIGGDEFVVVCYTKGNVKFLDSIVDRIITKMHEPVPFGDQTCRFGVSIGISHQEGKNVDGKKMLINADIALYRAKNSGRGCAEFFTEALHTEVVSHKRLSDEILVAIEEAQFINFYQPQIDARTNEICGVEALVRWQHPTRGLLAPDAFIDVAEEIDQVAMIDQQVLRQTLKDMVRWKELGINVPHASVNVSARRLNEPGLLEHLHELDIPRGEISFELMESIYLDEDDENLNWTIDQIKDLGIDIELDDFGTGHTSIVSLHSIKPKRLKIDRRLVIPIVDDASRLKIITSVIEIGKALDIVAVAEGVETMEHTRMLMEAGCYLMQGFGYSRPLSLLDFEQYVTDEKWKMAV